MKDYRIKELKDFLEIADNIETPLKFFEREDKIYAYVHMRTFLISWEGEAGKERVELLKKHGFKETKILETKKIVFEDII